MTKKRTNITLDPGVYERAKSKGINISRLTEQALRRFIGRLEGDKELKNGLFAEISGSNTETYPTPTGDRDQTKEEFLKDFRKSCQVDWNLAESTTRQRSRYASKLVDYLGTHPLKASKDQLREFIRKFNDDNAVKTVRIIYGRYFDKEIAQSFKIPKSEPKPKKVPDKAELKKIYKELESEKTRLAFLVLASSGLRRGELMELRPTQFKTEERAIYPPKGERAGNTKRQWVTFYNREAERAIEEFGLRGMDPKERIFNCDPGTLTRRFGRASERAGTIRTTPQTLRVWFADEMNRLGVADRYIDAFCGRTPKSVLARHYTDFSPRRLREVYEEAGIEVLG